MADTQTICAIVNRDKLEEYDRKILKEVVRELVERDLERKIDELYGEDIGKDNFKIYRWNNDSVLLIELNCEYLPDDIDLSDLKEFIFRKYGKVFVKETSMEKNFLIIEGYIHRDRIIPTNDEKLILPKDNLSELGKLVFDSIAEKNDCEGAFRLISELYLKNKTHQLNTITLKIGDVNISDKVMKVKLRKGKEKLYRNVSVRYDEEESKPSKIVFVFESTHYDHFRLLRNLLKSLLIRQ